MTVQMRGDFMEIASHRLIVIVIAVFIRLC